MAAVVARDAVVWPALLDLARSDAVGRGTRKTAVFWLGQRADDDVLAFFEEVLPRGR